MGNAISELNPIDETTITNDAVLLVTNGDGGSYKITLQDLKKALLTDDSILANIIADGAVTPEKLFAGAGTDWDWDSYSPTVTNFTKGSGTEDFKSIKIGKTVIVRFSFTMGSGSAMGTNPYFSLPYAANSAYNNGDYIGRARLLDAGNAGYPADVWIDSDNRFSLYGVGTAATYGGEYGLSSTVPFSWGSGDAVRGFLVYEAAS